MFWYAVIFRISFYTENWTKNHQAQWIRLWRHQTTRRAGTSKFLARMSSILRITWKRTGIHGTARSMLNRCTPWMNTVTSIQARSKHSNMLYLIPSLSFVYIQHSLISGMTNPMCFVKWKKRWKKFWIKCFVCPFGPKVISSRKYVMRVVEICQNDKTINIYSQNKLKCDSGFSDSFGDTTLVMRRRALTWRRFLKITIGFEYWRVTIIYGIKRSGLLQEKLLTITEWSSLCISSPLTLWNLLTVWFVFWITSVYAFFRMLFLVNTCMHNEDICNF